MRRPELTIATADHNVPTSGRALPIADELARKQLDLLKRAAKLLKPGGVLVYSTCSLETEENEEVIESFLKIHRHYRQETARTITPMKDGVDGAFVARLRCVASAVEQPVSRGEIIR